ncbi:MAG: hypothetical protein KAX13_04440 [Candidatus Krumholzibacteria bacterium]|nr:hypothetical protein [Candidatus Krumholzibacteria bacterium]
MKRVSVLLLLAIALLTFTSGCDEAVEAQATGITIRCSNCLTFEVWVWVDDNFMNIISSEEPATFEISSGSHSLFARSNVMDEDIYWCWSLDFSVSDGNVTSVILDCTGAECTGGTD